MKQVLVFFFYFFFSMAFSSSVQKFSRSLFLLLQHTVFLFDRATFHRESSSQRQRSSENLRAVERTSIQELETTIKVIKANPCVTANLS